MTSLLPRHGFLLSNPFSGADGASPSNFWMGTRSAFRNPFRVPLRPGAGSGAGSVPRIQMFWTRRAPWFFARKPFPRRRRSVALQLLDGDAVCLSKPVPGSATNVAGAGSVPRIHMFWTRRAPWIFALKPFLRCRRSLALQLLWRARSAFRNPFRVPLRTGFGILGAGSVPRIYMFWTRRAPWIFCSQTLSPAPTERRPPTFVAGAVCFSKPVPGSATNGIWDPEF